MKLTKLLFFLVLGIYSFGQIPAPIDYYPFTAGSIAGLTQNGAAMTSIDDRANSATDAVSLNGDYLTRGAFNAENITISYWLKTTTSDGNSRAIINQTSGNKGWYTYLQNGLVGFGASYEHGQQVNGTMQQYYTGYSFLNSTTNVADGYWHNVIITMAKSIYFDGAGYVKSYVYTLYVDGVQEGTTTVLRGSSGSFTNVYSSLCWNIPVTIAMNVANKYTDGLDDIRFYNSVVNATGIEALSQENYCPHPENVTFTSTTINSTLVNWGSSFDAQSWDLTYVESGQPIANGTTIAGITANTEYLSGLTHNTTYDVYLTSNCSSFTGAVGPAVSFTTLCQSASTAAMANDLTIQLDANGSATITAADINNNSLNSCGVAANVTIDVSSFDCTNIGANTVTLTATDNLGNSSTATSTVTILPMAIAQDINAYLDANGSVTVDPALVDNGSNTVCGASFTASLDISTFSCAEKGANNVVLSINDGNGNIGTANAIITVLDTIAPTVLTRDVTITLDGNYQGVIINSMINNGSTDNCSGVLTYSLSKTNFNCEDQGANTITLTVTDVEGNSASATAIVTVNQVYPDVSVTAAQTQFCDNANASTTITTGGSSVGVNYSLRDQNNTIIDGPLAGTGNPLVFNTGIVTADNTYNVYASNSTGPSNNNSLDFDGLNDVVHTNLTLPSLTAFTIEFWTYPRSTNYDRLISNYTGNFGGQLAIDTYNATDNGRGLRAYIVGSGGVVLNVGAANALTLNTWNHVAVTFNSGTGKLIVNGVEIASVTGPFNFFPANSNTYSFGEDPTINTAEYLNGKLDDIRFWNVAKTPGQISAEMNSCLVGNETNLLAYYNFEAGTGIVATDLVAGKNGNLTNMTNTAWTAGAFACGSNCNFQMSQTVTVGVGQSQSRTETAYVCSGSDFTFPDGTVQNNVTTQVVHTSNLTTVASGCDSTIVTTLEVNPIYNSAETVEICSGSDHTFPDGTTQTNIITQFNYTSTLQSVNSCDSIIVTSIVIRPTYNLDYFATVCEGDSYTFPDGTVQANITADFNYVSSLQTVGYGCDSLVTTYVTVNPSYNLSETFTICAGQDYTFPDGTTQTAITSQVIYTSNLQTLNNCDSIIVTTLNVNPSYNLTENAVICAGQDYTFPDGTTQTGITSQVIYTSSFQTTLNCDSIIVTTLDVNPSYNLTFLATVCPGSSYTFPDGTSQSNITAQIVYTSNLQTSLGCDSIIVTTVDVNSTINVSETVALCAGSDYTFPDGTVQNNITADLVYTSSLVSAQGCDSIVETTINVNQISTTAENVTLCEGSSYTFPDGSFDANITASISYTSVLTSILTGCDSIVQTNIDITPIILVSESVNVCSGSDYTFPDGSIENNIVGDFTYESVFTSLISGCDSIISTAIIVEGPFSTSESVSICSGSDYTFPDGSVMTNITTSVVYTSVLQSTGLGCDSLVQTSISVDALETNVTLNGNELTAVQTGVTYQWVNCDDNNSPIAGATAQTFTPTVDGNYACILNEGSPCSVTTACTQVALVGIAENIKTKIQVYPNPTNDVLNIVCESEEIKITIHSLTGELVQTETNKTFSVANLASGTYLMEIKSDLGTERIKFVKN